MNADEIAAWLRERADSYSRDALFLDGDGYESEAITYRTIANELRTVAELCRGAVTP